MQTHRVVYTIYDQNARRVPADLLDAETSTSLLVRLYDSSMGAIHDQVVVNPREADGNADA